MPLLKLAAFAIIAMPLPLFLLSPTTPWPVATVVIGAFAFFVPLVNAPIVGLLTVRTPAELRPKVFTGFMTVASMAGPLGFIAAGFTLLVRAMIADVADGISMERFRAHDLKIDAKPDLSPVTEAEADAYFATRPKQAQIGAWASKQSQPLESRFAFEQAVAKIAARHIVGEVPRPAGW